MNKRIRELADEAARYAAISALPTGKGGDELFLEMFAELIAMECMNICKDVIGESNIDARSGRQDCYCEIRDHFGVEDE